MRFIEILSVGAVLVELSLAAASGQGQGASLPKTTFEENEGGWIVFGQDAKVSVTHDAANVKEGKGALQYNYNIAKGIMGALALPTPSGALTKMKSMKFWIKTDHTTPVAVFMQEKDGGRYTSGFTAEQDKWQRVELSASDFHLSQGPMDPKDPNDKLDLDKVENIGIGDFGQFLIQADPNLAGLFNIKPGPHTLYVDDFQVTEDTLTDSSPTSGGEF